MRLIHRPLKWCVQHLIVRLCPPEILLHQRIIQFHNLIEHRSMRFGDRQNIALTLFVQQAFHNRFIATRRQIDRQTLVPERLLDLREQRFQIQFRLIDLVDDDRARNIPRSRDFHHSPGDNLNPALRVDDNHDGFHRRHRCDRMSNQIRAARRVDDIDSLAKMIDVKHG